MKLIKQKHYTACGVASLAMVADITYRQAMKLLHPKRFWWFSDASTSPLKIMEALDDLGIIYAFYFDQNKDFHPGKRAIITIRSGNMYHAVVWDPERQVILDPYRTKKHRSLEDCLENFHCAIVIEDAII